MALKYIPLSSSRSEEVFERQFEQSLTRRLEDVRNELETNVTESPMLGKAAHLLIEAAYVIRMAVQAPLPPEEASEPEEPEETEDRVSLIELRSQLQELRHDLDRMQKPDYEEL